jgi:hypothetical protein
VDIATEIWLKLARVSILFTVRAMRRYCRPGERGARSAELALIRWVETPATRWKSARSVRSCLACAYSPLTGGAAAGSCFNWASRSLGIRLDGGQDLSMRFYYLPVMISKWRRI